jgi:F0F1-type ATP synthase assembly protein I
MMTEPLQRELREGGGDAFSAAFEMVVTPALFGLLGWFIDTQLNLFPVFTLLLVFLVLGYEVWKLVSRFNESFDAERQARRAAYDAGRKS